MNPRPSKQALVVMGVAGCGKTTVSAILADRLGWTFAEADEFHPPANVDKMSSGIPLTDEDRWPWLEDLRRWIDTTPGSAVMTCSALRRSYREVLSRAEARVRFVHLNGTREQLQQRISARIGHFMPASMLDSQLATLELLSGDEDGVVIGIDGTPGELAERAQTALGLRPHTVASAT